MTIPEILNTPSKPVERGAATLASQRDRRFMDTFFDTYRHPRFPNGRPFCGLREFQSGSQTESIAAGFLQSDLQCGEYFCESPERGQTPQERAQTIASTWTAPWLPRGGKKYMEFNYRRKTITFNYVRLIADETRAYEQFFQAAAKIAGENDVIDPERPLALPYKIKVTLGDPMRFRNEVRLARAAQAGDPWLMGAVQEPNEELAKILGLDVHYLGSTQEHGDREFVTVAKPKAPEPLLTPEAVLAAAASDLARMVAEAVAQALAAQDAAKKAKQRDGMAKARAARKPRATAGANAE